MATEATPTKSAPADQKPQSFRFSLDRDRISERTTAGVFFRQAAKLRDKPLFHHHRDGRWTPISWNEMESLVLATAAALIESGVQPRDHVILMSPNRHEWLVCDFAIQAAGAITVPIYPSTLEKQACEIADNSGAVLAIVSDEKMASKLKTQGALKKIVRMDRELREWMRGKPAPAALKEVEKRLTGIGAEDTATVIYTSGTTGQPKGVVLLHRNFTDMASVIVDLFQISQDDVALSFLPYSHVFERMGIFAGIAAGASGYLARGQEQLGEDIQHVRPTFMSSVPRVYEKMYGLVQKQVERQPGYRQAIFRWAVGVGKKNARGQGGIFSGAQRRAADGLVLAALRQRLTGGRLRYFVSGGAPLATEIEEFFWAAGIKILQGWGLTETTAGATSNTEGHHRFGTVGRAFPGVELKLDKDGEILVKGPNVMAGYYRNQQATDEVMQDGWFRTGDIGDIDGDGFLKITDRKKELLKTAGGKYVAPQPIEGKLQDDRLIERAVLIGDERPYVTALIVPDWEALKKESRASGDPEQLAEDERVKAAVQQRIDRVNRELAGHESIKYFALLPNDFSEEKGEMTPTLKVKRRVIQERYKEVIDGLYRGRQKPEGSGSQESS